ncbi:hypothetical protein RND81_04G143500 [Saponaria officinalis]|uniref:Uncharacterized protein n=1 Tax=Saponaria officinalis TaxID=3572 RepID=A0AAW1LPN3_SAPOF
MNPQTLANKYGSWSGSATLLPGNKPTILFTGIINPQPQNGQTFSDGSKNRRVLLGWANESSSVADDVKKGWSGIHTIPGHIWLDKSKKQLIQWPISEIEKLRGKPVKVDIKEIKAGASVEVSGITAAQIDHSVVESFGAKGKNVITSRVYPTMATFNKAHLYAFKALTMAHQVLKLPNLLHGV